MAAAALRAASPGCRAAAGARGAVASVLPLPPARRRCHPLSAPLALQPSSAGRPTASQQQQIAAAALAAARSPWQQQQQQQRSWLRRRAAGIACHSSGTNKGGGIQNYELLVGDCLCLLCFALYKQITAIIFLPTFPGWLAPLAFNPDRFLEFISFAATLVGTWVAAGLLMQGYRFSATATMQTALTRTCLMWLLSMPVAASQLVLLTAAKGPVLVGDEGFAATLPLAATGAGEPFVTAAGVLGLMCVWRAFYCSYLDLYSFGKLASAAGRDRARDMEHFSESLRGAVLLSLACCAVLQVLGVLVGEEQLELMAGSLLAQIAALYGGG